MVRNINHGWNTGDITFSKDCNFTDPEKKYFKVDFVYDLATSFNCKGEDSTSYAFEADGGGLITDSYLGYYDILPLTDLEFCPYSDGEMMDEVIDYVKNHFIILIPKYYHRYDRNGIRYGFVNDDGSYSNSIYWNNIPITIPNVLSGTMLCGEFPNNPESLNFTINDSAVVSHDSTKFVLVSDPDSPDSIMKSYTIRDRVDYSVKMARHNQYDIMRGDYSSFDLVDDIKIQLPEEQADILTNFRKYIN